MVLLNSCATVPTSTLVLSTSTPLPVQPAITPQLTATEIPIPLVENHDPFQVNEIITEQQALNQGYSPEMAKYLDGSVVEFRGGMLTSVKDGKAIAYVDGKSARWEVLREFSLAADKQEARSVCNIRETDVADWIRYVKLNDPSGPFTDRVIMWPLTEGHMLVGGPQNGSVVEWLATETNTNPGHQFTDPETRRMKQVSFCTLNGQSIRLIKFLNESGKISWFGLRTINPDENPKSDAVDFPIIEVKIPGLEGLNDPFVASELRKWLGDNFGAGDFPESLEDRLLWAIV